MLFAVGLIRYRIFRANVDLGLFTQVIASTFGNFSSLAEGGINHLAVHFSPILFACAPLLWITRSPIALIAIQAVASGLCAPPVYLLAARRLSPRAALFAAIAAMTYPPMIAMTVGDFHELAFATPAILWLAWAVDARRLRRAVVFAALALTIKEDVTLVIGSLAIFGAIRAHRSGDVRLRAFFLSLCGAAALELTFYYGALRPALMHGRFAGLPHFYNWQYTGPSPLGYAPLGSPLRGQYLEGVLLPLLAVPLFSPAILLAIPGLLEVLASHEAITLELSMHYVACWLPYVLIAFVFGLARIARRSKALAYVVLAGIFASSLYIDAYASPARWYYQIYRLPNARDALVDRTLATLPRDASIAGDLALFAHMGLNPRATFDPTHTEIDVVDRQCASPDCKTQIFPFVDAALARGALSRRSAEDGIEVYVRSSPKTGR